MVGLVCLHPHGLVNARIFTDNATEDLSVVHSLQDQMTWNAIPRASATIAPKLDMKIFTDPYFNPANDTAVAWAVMRLAAIIAPLKKPEVVVNRTWIAQMLGNAGIKEGMWT